MSGLKPNPSRTTVASRIDLPRFSQAVWEDVVAIRKDSEALATFRDIILKAATSDETAILGDIQDRLECAAEDIRTESSLLPFFKSGSFHFGIDAIKGTTSRLAGSVAAGAVVGGTVGSLPGAVAGAAAGGISGAAVDFMMKLATRSFDKSHQARSDRAELFVKIAQKIEASSG